MAVVFPWLPGSDAAWSSFEAHLDAFTHISPTGLAFRPDGSIAQADRPDLTKVAQIAKDHQLLVLPLIVNENFQAQSAEAVLCDKTVRQRAIDELARLVEANQWDGINLDFEGPWAYRSQYVAFVSGISKRLHDLGKLVTVDVVSAYRPPRGVEGDPGLSWSDPYDYPALGQLVDLFILMGYDYHYRFGHPGPVGPAWWLERVLDWTTSVVPSHKVVLGLPFYGYHWTVTEAGETVDGAYLPFAEAERLRCEHRVWRAWDWDGLSRYFHFREPDQPNVEHIVHYDDAASLAQRMQLISRYHLAGVAFWSLGQEDPDVWSFVKKQIKGAESTASPAQA